MKACKYFLVPLFMICMWTGPTFGQQTPWNVPGDWVEVKNPVILGETSISQGKKLYASYCTPCHGSDGRGNGELAASLEPRPADHTGAEFKQQKPGEVYYKIITGRNAMPAFDGTMSEEQIWDLVNYIRTLEPEKRRKKKGEEPQPVIPEEGNASTAETTPEGTQPGQPASLNKQRFVISGSANANIVAGGDRFHLESAGFEAGFKPLLLWKASDKLFFESHLHMQAGGGGEHSNEFISNDNHTHRLAGGALPVQNNGGSTQAPSSQQGSAASASAEIMLSYANLVFFVNNSITFTGGLFLSPFGIYSERLHADWINKMGDAPLGLGHADQLVPEAELGFQIRGRLPTGKISTNYALYVSNGPALIDSGSQAGKLSFSNLNDNNQNKMLGGRLGIFPVPALESGVSIQRGRVGTDGTFHQNVRALLYAFDISYYKSYRVIRGAIDIKGQYSRIEADKAYYKASPELTLSVPFQDVILEDSLYRFDNESDAYFLSASYRPLTSGRKLLRNFEGVVRYDVIRTPCYALWNADESRWTGGLIYWIDSRSAFKLSYGLSDIKNQLIFQFVIGL